MIDFEDHPEFTPDYSPEQMVEKGVFSGTYFRRIYSSVNDRYYENAHLEFPWGRKYQHVLCMEVPNSEVNCYKVNVGTSLEFWESKNWIVPQDPYGWFQWYCRFYYGRRTPDDTRQIKRWRSAKNRFTGSSNVWNQIRLHWAIGEN